MPPLCTMKTAAPHGPWPSSCTTLVHEHVHVHVACALACARPRADGRAGQLSTLNKVKSPSAKYAHDVRVCQTCACAKSEPASVMGIRGDPSLAPYCSTRKSQLKYSPTGTSTASLLDSKDATVVAHPVPPTVMCLEHRQWRLVPICSTGIWLLRADFGHSFGASGRDHG